MNKAISGLICAAFLIGVVGSVVSGGRRASDGAGRAKEVVVNRGLEEGVRRGAAYELSAAKRLRYEVEFAKSHRASGEPNGVFKKNYWVVGAVTIGVSSVQESGYLIEIGTSVVGGEYYGEWVALGFPRTLN